MPALLPQNGRDGELFVPRGLNRQHCSEKSETQGSDLPWGAMNDAGGD